MEIIADLHIHSKYARATSKNISIENLEKYARVKGLNLLGTGDFQHALRRKEIDEKLTEDDKGILWTKDGFPFLWQTEISLMFSQNEKRRAIHLLVFAPNSKTADKITLYLSSKGRIDYDGRPIFGLSCTQFVKDLKEINDKIEIIPAHCMTPWFGLYGSKSGFDSIKECFGEQADKIYAIESGMSADPEMLWKINENVNIVSFSDAHSFWPWRLGREATRFDIDELSYDNIIQAIRTGKGLKATIETPPTYGKYHWDGHRNCNFSCSPDETIKLNGKCPICKGNLTIGVDYRVEEISKEKKEYQTKNAKPYHSLVPLHELIAISIGSTLASKKTWEVYNFLIERLGNEFNILLKTEKEELIKILPKNEKLVELILINRNNKLQIKPGYDGTYGEIVLSDKQAKLPI